MIRRGSKRSAYATRDRDFEYMGWVKSLPCAASHHGRCAGEIEADHAGRRGLSRKAEDDTCIPLCQLHHRQRTDFTGPFKTWTRDVMREFLDQAISWTRARWLSR